MPSDHRLHPASFLFAIAGHLKNFLLPGIVVLFTAGVSGGDWQIWLMTLVVPVAAFSILRALSYRYRLDDAELVVRTGFVFRNERHIPYARIQNVEVIENVFHRLLGVVEVKVETGGGQEDEARMQVVTRAAHLEIRERAFAHKRPAARAESEEAEPAAAATPIAGTIVLQLPPGELLLSGLIANRSAVVIAAAFGVIWELGLFDFFFTWIFGDKVTGRSIVTQLARAFTGRGYPSVWYLTLAVGTMFALFAAVTAISMVWALVRLYGFTLRRVGDDLLAEFGLFTRITTTIPLRRIQTLTIFEGPLYRVFDRARVNAETAGGDAGDEGKARREPLVPIIRRVDLEPFLAHVLPDIDFVVAGWERPAPRAFVRELRQGLIAAAVVSMFFVVMLKFWTPLLFACFVALAVVHARRYVAMLGWTITGTAVLFRRGWLWRRLTAARFSKMQTVALRQSPFDRRHDMARVHVDTAGATDSSDAVNIPYLSTEAARDLHLRLSAEASRTHFEW
jgi:putative membrane protein